jgi:hypothetical protein
MKLKTAATSEKQQSNKTLNEGIRHTFELEGEKLAVGSSVRFQKQVTKHFGGTGPLPNKRRDH